jgi:hypothetical protein
MHKPIEGGSLLAETDTKPSGINTPKIGLLAAACTTSSQAAQTKKPKHSRPTARWLLLKKGFSNKHYKNKFLICCS